MGNTPASIETIISLLQLKGIGRKSAFKILQWQPLASSDIHSIFDQVDKVIRTGGVVM
jgi:hypothetical protein